MLLGKMNGKLASLMRVQSNVNHTFSFFPETKEEIVQRKMATKKKMLPQPKCDLSERYKTINGNINIADNNKLPTSNQLILYYIYIFV